MAEFFVRPRARSRTRGSAVLCDVGKSTFPRNKKKALFGRVRENPARFPQESCQFFSEFVQARFRRGWTPKKSSESVVVWPRLGAWGGVRVGVGEPSGPATRRWCPFPSQRRRREPGPEKDHFFGGSEFLAESGIFAKKKMKKCPSQDFGIFEPNLAGLSRTLPKSRRILDSVEKFWVVLSGNLNTGHFSYI